MMFFLSNMFLNGYIPRFVQATQRNYSFVNTVRTSTMSCNDKLQHNLLPDLLL